MQFLNRFGILGFCLFVLLTSQSIGGSDPPKIEDPSRAGFLPERHIISPLEIIKSPESPWVNQMENQRDKGFLCPYTQSYMGPEAYYWPTPYETYGISSYAMRFTTCYAETLLSVDIMIYQAVEKRCKRHCEVVAGDRGNL